MATVAEGIIQGLIRAGVSHLFGMPGGGSNADLVEAAGKAGLPFVMSHSETAAAFMASAQAEISGKPGACLATLGPGAASVINGTANAWLDRIPLLLFTDCHSQSKQSVMQHQTLNQAELFRPVTKWSTRLQAENVAETLGLAVSTALEPRPGPVHLDCPAEISAVDMKDSKLPAGHKVNRAGEKNAKSVSSNLLPAEVEQILRKARRPLVLVGLEGRNAPGLLEFCENYNIPALLTYKAKGVIPDAHRCFAGVLTNGALERPILEQADLFIAVGLDPVELLALPWNYPQPLISCSGYPIEQSHLTVSAALVGNAARYFELLGSYLTANNEWDFERLREQVDRQRSAMRPAGEAGALLPHRVVEIVAEGLPGVRVSVDAGAHMFPVMALWMAAGPNNILISNGLATMGFALPAAIGAALLEPFRTVVAFTGDGGLMMCLAELKTAVRENLRLRVIVFDDGELSLIKVKQEQRGYQTNGVSLGATNWLALGTAFGLAAYAPATEKELEQVIVQTADYQGPVLIAAKINPQSYRPTIRALRG